MAITRPAEFLASLNQIDSIKEIKTLARLERKYLKENYNTLASLKNGYTVYRNYFKANVAPDSIKNNKPVLDALLKIFRLVPKQQKLFTEAGSFDVRKNKSNLRHLFSVDNYINRAIELLSSKSYVNQILGLCALTGRRAAEIACSAEFKIIGANNYLLQFTGQLKTKARNDVMPYNIPVLYSTSKLVDALYQIRVLKPQFINNPALFHDASSRALTNHARKYFAGLFEGEPKVKDLRAIYALICFSRFSTNEENKKIDRDVYFSRILGHKEDDVTTCDSYVDFYV